MSGTERGKPLKAPQGGWPHRPVGDRAKLDAIVSWLALPGDNSQRSTIVRNRADAEHWVRSIASILLADLRAHSGSRTLKETEEILDELRDAALDLLRKFSAVSGSYGLARTVALECGFFKRTYGKGRTVYDLVDWDEVLSKPLCTLAATAEAYKAEIAGSVTTRKGRQNLYDRAFGDPRRKLTRTCAELLRHCRQGEEGAAPSDALVLKLSEMIWAFATGEDPLAGFLDSEARSGSVAARLNEPRDRLPQRSKSRVLGLIDPKNPH